MTTTAQSVILDVQTQLQDLSGIRWPASELVRHLNDMQRLIAEARPDSTAESVTLTLVAGVKQTIPATAASLIEIDRNVSGKQKAIRQVVRNMLDAIEPGWASGTQKGEIVHVMFDPRKPRIFEVYPPAVVSTQIIGTVSNFPTDVAAPSGAGLVASTVSGNISLADSFKNALHHLVLWRAFSKDAEFGGNAALAQTNFGMAERLLGVELQAKTTAKPTVNDSVVVTG